jgi:hypothetical protein
VSTEHPRERVRTEILASNRIMLAGNELLNCIGPSVISALDVDVDSLLGNNGGKTLEVLLRYAVQQGRSWAEEAISGSQERIKEVLFMLSQCLPKRC